MSAAGPTTRVIRFEDMPRQRWRNGGGWTRELLAWPAQDDWRVRVSVADIESDGPFSAFPGVRRFFAVLDGAGVELTIDGRSQQVTRGDDAVTFSGEAATSCRLIAGPTRDLNLMVRDAEGAMQRASAGQVWQPVARACGLFATATGHCRAGEHATALPAYALLWFDAAPAALAFDASGWWLAA